MDEKGGFLWGAWKKQWLRENAVTFIRVRLVSYYIRTSSENRTVLSFGAVNFTATPQSLPRLLVAASNPDLQQKSTANFG